MELTWEMVVRVVQEVEDLMVITVLQVVVRVCRDRVIMEEMAITLVARVARRVGVVARVRSVKIARVVPKVVQVELESYPPYAN
jgi:hypothetical protein